MKKKWVILALILTLVLPALALAAPTAMEALSWQFGSDPAVAVIQGEHLGLILRMVLLTAVPFVPLLCFILERVGLSSAKRQRESAQPPEFASEEERRAFYLRELDEERRAEHGAPWLAYASLCGLGVLIFGFGVLAVRLPRQIEKIGRDLELYKSERPAVYEGSLLLGERPVRNGAKQIPDERFVYYNSGEGSLQCAVSLISQTQLMQPSYTVTYLPETGTILSITDADGNLRTAGAELELPTPEGCWMYGDLAVPVCDGVEGYAALSAEQRALFDLMYSQVLSGRVAAGEQPTRSFDLPYPLSKEEFNAVLALYETSVEPGQYPNHGYRTDDGRIVRRAYCYGIIHTR